MTSNDITENREQFINWLLSEEEKYKKSSMWKELIKDFSNDSSKADSVFDSYRRLRGYNFCSRKSVNISIVFWKLLFLFTWIFSHINSKLWSLNLNNGPELLRVYPLPQRALQRMGLWNEYLLFCKKNNFYPDNCTAIKLYYIANKASSLLQQNRKNKVLEIGAGTGGLATYILDKGLCDQYVIVDLAEMLTQSSRTLLEMFPFIKQYFLFPGNVAPDFEKPGIYFCTPDCIDRLPDKTFDLAINIDSFQEMTKEQVGSYIDLIQWSSKHDSYFFNINRRKYLGEEKFDNNPLLYPYKKDNIVTEWHLDPFFAATLNKAHNRTDGWITKIERIQHE